MGKRHEPFSPPDESSIDDDYDVYRPPEQEGAVPEPPSDDPDINAQLQGQKIQNERGRDKLSDYGQSLLG